MILSFLPGRVVDIDSEMLTTGQIESIVTWTRSFHRAVVAFEHAGPWRFREIRPWTLIGHNDIAPYNVCFNGDDLLGVFDWDLAGPTTPLLELAFIAWNCVLDALAAAGCHAAIRGGSLRIAPHLHTTAEDIETLLHALATALHRPAP